MASVTIGFSIPEEDVPRLDHLAKVFADGNRSAFLRFAMKRMEVLERAQKLEELAEYGARQRTAAGLDDVPVEEIVHRVLSKQPVGR